MLDFPATPFDDQIYAAPNGINYRFEYPPGIWVALGTGIETTGTGKTVLQTSPDLLGNPTAPTPLNTDNDNTIATTAFVQTAFSAAIGGSIPTGPANGAGSDLAGTYPSPTIKANVTLTGNPTTNTQLDVDDSTRIATTEFVKNVAPRSVNTLADLKALPANAATTVTMNMVNTTCRTGGGTFRWLAGNQAQKILDQSYDGGTTAATEAMWVAPSVSPTGSAGVWERILDSNQLDIGCAGIYGEVMDPYNGAVPTIPAWTYPWRNIYALCAKHGFELTIPGGVVYHLHSTWTSTGSNMDSTTFKGLSIRGVGAKRPVLYFNQGAADIGVGPTVDSRNFLQAHFNDPAQITLTGATGPAAIIYPNQKKITFKTSTAALKRGQLISICSDLLWDSDSRGYNFTGEMQSICDVASPTPDAASPLPANTIEIARATMDRYDPVANVVTCTVFTPGRFAIRNVEIYGPRPASNLAEDWGGAAISITKCLNPIIENCRINSSSGSAINVQRSMDTIIRDVWVNYEKSGVRPESNGSSTIYGILMQSCMGTRMFNVHGRTCRRFIDFGAMSGSTQGGPSRDQIVDGFSAWGGGYAVAGRYFEPDGTLESFGVGGHAVDSTTFMNGMVGSLGCGINIRGVRTKISGIRFVGIIRRDSGSRGCIAADCGMGLQISDCQYNRGDYGFAGPHGTRNEEQAWCFLTLGGGNAEVMPPWKGDMMTTVSNIQCDGLERCFVRFNPVGFKNSVNVTGDADEDQVAQVTDGAFTNVHFSDIKVKPAPNETENFYVFDVDESNVGNYPPNNGTTQPFTGPIPLVNLARGSAMGIHLQCWTTNGDWKAPLLYNPNIKLGSLYNGSLTGWWIGEHTVALTLPANMATPCIIPQMILDRRCANVTISGRLTSEATPTNTNLCGQFAMFPGATTFTSQGTVGSLLSASYVTNKVHVQLVDSTETDYLSFRNAMSSECELIVTIL